MTGDKPRKRPQGASMKPLWISFASLLLAAGPLAVPPAFGDTYSASSDAPHAGWAFDGDIDTRWSSDFSDPQWLQADFGSPRLIDHAIIDWESAYGKSYKVQVSSDGAAWSDVYSATAGDGARDVAVFPAVTAQYVRLLGTERGTPW